MSAERDPNRERRASSELDPYAPPRASLSGPGQEFLSRAGWAAPCASDLPLTVVVRREVAQLGPLRLGHSGWPSLVLRRPDRSEWGILVRFRRGLRHGIRLRNPEEDRLDWIPEGPFLATHRMRLQLQEDSGESGPEFVPRYDGCLGTLGFLVWSQDRVEARQRRWRRPDPTWPPTRSGQGLQGWARFEAGFQGASAPLWVGTGNLTGVAGVRLERIEQPAGAETELQAWLTLLLLLGDRYLLQGVSP